MEIIEIKISELKVESQPREDIDGIHELAETYKTQGIIHPIEIDREGTVITGERRFRAAKEAGFKTIPCKKLDKQTPEQKLERQLIENIHHKPLTDLEKAKAIKKLIDLKGWSGFAAAANLGIGEATIRRLLSLIKAPPEIKKMVEDNTLPGSEAGELCYALRDKPQEAIEVAKKTSKANRNRRQIMRSAIKEGKLRENQKPIPKGEYDVIYADPPWEYDFSKNNADSIEAHYPTMKLEEICNLQIPAAENAVMFLWATAPKLKEALKVMERWGFTYKTNLVWVKDKFGLGYWCRNQHELLLIGTKGEFSPPAPENRFSSVINSPRNEHSAKPEEIYERLEKLLPGRKYLELFARENNRENWDTWGLEYGNNKK